MKNKRFLNKNLANNTTTADMAAIAKQKRVLPHVPKAVARTRQDVGKWNTAQNLTTTDEPKNWMIQNLFNETGIDAVLTSQLQNRMQQSLSMPFKLTNDKAVKDEEQTAKLKKSLAYLQIVKAIWEKRIYGYNLIELQLAGETLFATQLPRQNVVPQKGFYYPDYGEDGYVEYRKMKEFGTWILEFDSGDLGLINKAVPHVLFKRFAQSCWSELCEIYGIPPRVLKTNTQDAGMLNRADSMMREMAAAAWFIIDSEETFEWADGNGNANGDVYKNLINLCNNEISLLITGAVIGQDTQNGSRSKDESGQKQLGELVKSDLTDIAQTMNSIVIPALVSIGFLKGDIVFEFDTVEDTQQLFERTKELLPFYTVDPEWAKKTFSVEITGERQTLPNPSEGGSKGKKLSDDLGFFD